MSAIPSLSVWSSIKIPDLVYSGKSRNQTKSSVPYVDSWKGGKRGAFHDKNKNQSKEIFQMQGSNSESKREVVNLRVPTPLRKGKENSFPDVTCTCQVIRKKRGYRKRSQKINSLCVPDMSAFDMSCNWDWQEGCPNRYEYCDELCQGLNFDENWNDETKMNCIPSVKPCTKEELLMINKRSHLKEEKTKTATEKKKIKRRVKITKSEQTTPKTPNKTSCLDSYRSRKSQSQNFCYNREPQDSLSPVETTGRNYYETKLAELYMIELGIKR